MAGEGQQIEDREHGRQMLEARDREAIMRLRSPLPQPDLCPTCWFIHGMDNEQVAVHHPNPDKFDRMKCKKYNYVEDRDARP